MDVVPSMQGYSVIKLDPAALDRESTYGTLATYDGMSGFYATPTTYTKVRVFDTRSGSASRTSPPGQSCTPGGRVGRDQRDRQRRLRLQHARDNRGSILDHLHHDIADPHHRNRCGNVARLTEVGRSSSPWRQAAVAADRPDR